MLDLLIRGGIVIDGSGAPGASADVGVREGRIVEVGRITEAAQQTIDADGALVTPGFIDIHTHYDGQASWDETFSPSIYHGVTTVVMGNCGVGFAPVKRGEEQRLINLMEGVEEIPGAALAEGVRWGWDSFTEYARVLDAMPHSIDFMTLVPHDPLRLYVMGDRAARCEAATPDDCVAMRDLLHAALAAGAAGFSTGRSDNHRTSKGEETPAHVADRAELLALAGALQGLPYRVLHAVNDFDCGQGTPGDAAAERARFDAEYALMEDMARAAQRPLALTWLERINAPLQRQWLMESAERSAAHGLDVRLQTACRAIGVMNGLDTSFNVLMAFPAYREIMQVPVAERAALMRDPARRARLLAETPLRLANGDTAMPPLVDQLVARLNEAAMLMFPFSATSSGPQYEPAMNTSLFARAQQRGITPLAAIYDYLAGLDQGSAAAGADAAPGAVHSTAITSGHDGSNLIYFPIFNYLGGSLDTVYKMLTHPQALLALGDAGAHVGTVCDASLPTTLLAHWTRDRAVKSTSGAGNVTTGQLSVERAVAMLTSRNARHMGLRDRGVIAPGLKADLNVIDYVNLAAATPTLVRDLPAGGKRFVQNAHGYVATISNGQVVCAGGSITAARPGHWARAIAG